MPGRRCHEYGSNEAASFEASMDAPHQVPSLARRALRFWHELCHHRRQPIADNPSPLQPHAHLPTADRLARTSTPCSSCQKNQRHVLRRSRNASTSTSACTITTTTATNTAAGAHRAHHRRLPRRHPLRLPASHPLPWLLAEPAQALPHPVQRPVTPCGTTSSHVPSLFSPLA